MNDDLKLTRRVFVKKTSIITVGVGFTGKTALASFTPTTKNKLPKWKGFNLLDFFSPNPANSRKPTTEDHLRWMADWGFDFVRLPMAYPYYLDFDRAGT